MLGYLQPFILVPSSPRYYMIPKVVQSFFFHHSLIDQVLCQTFDNLHLILDTEPLNDRLHDTSDAGLIYGNEALVVHEGKEAHDELTVHAIGYTAMAWDRLTKVFDFKGAFESRGEESSEWSDE